MELRAIRKRVIAKAVPRPNRYGDIYLPDNSDGDKAEYFDVMSVGPLAMEEYPLLREGARVIATKYAHTGEKLQGEYVYTLDADAIMAVVH